MMVSLWFSMLLWIGILLLFLATILKGLKEEKRQMPMLKLPSQS